MIALFLFAPISQAENDAIVVTADRSQEKEATGSKTVIKIDEKQPGLRDLADAIRLSPGSNIRRYGGLGDYATVSIRGASSRQVLVFLDGIPLNPDGVSAFNLSELPLRFFDKVSIWRSAAPASYFSAPIGGVVDLRPIDNPQGQAQYEVGSYGWQRSGGGMGIVAGTSSHLMFMDHFNTRGDFPYLNTQATRFNQDDDVIETRQNNDKSQLNLLHRSKFGDWTVLSQYTNRSEGLPGTFISQTQNTSLDTNRWLMALKWRQYRGRWDNQVLGWNRRQTNRYVDREGEFGQGRVDSTNTFDSQGIQIESKHIGWQAVQPGLGYAFRHEEHRENNVESQTDTHHARRFVQKAYIEAPVWAWKERFHLKTLLQANMIIGTDANEDEGIQTTWAPRASLHWQGKTWRTWAAFGRGFRPPTMMELYGQEGVVVGNADLNPESSDALEAGVSFKWEKLNLLGQVAAFSQNATDHIILIQNAQRTVFPTNFGQTWTGGIETQFNWNWKNLMAIDTAFTWMQSTNKSELSFANGKALPHIPTWTWNQSHTFTWKGFTVQHQLFFNSGYFRDEANWEYAAPTALHNLSLQKQGTKHWPTIELQCQNLSDQRSAMVDIDPLQPNLGKSPEPLANFTGRPLPGRVFMLRLTWALEDK